MDAPDPEKVGFVLQAWHAVTAVISGVLAWLAAVRQILADKPMAPDQFSRQLRPALKSSGLADDAALNLIESKLQAIKEMKVPQAEKLGAYRRIALQAIGGYSASGATRGSVEAAKAVPY